MSISDVLKKIAKKYGEGAAQFYGDMDKIDVKRISSGVTSIDNILGGGIPEGRIIEIFGQLSSGKTTLAIKFLSEVQKKYPGKRVAFIDVEHALDPAYAVRLGLDIDKVILSQPSSAEEALGIMKDLIESGEVKAVVLDSVAKLCPRKEIEGDIGDAEMGLRARLMGQMLRIIVPSADKNECTCFFINQVRESMNMYGPTETRPGGKALGFDASIIVKTSHKKIDGDKGTTKIQVIKNKVGKPFLETEVELIYGQGFNTIKDKVTASMQMGLIRQGGAMYYFGENDKYKYKGISDVYEAIETDPKFRTDLDKAINIYLSKKALQ